VIAFFEPPSSMSVEHALTIDVEDYFQVSAFEHSVQRSQWTEYESRVEANTRRVLRLLERHQTLATFFVLGWVAEKYPHLVREIQAPGHQIASHGYWHRLIYEQTPAEFREDVRLAKSVLSHITGQDITAYRAPSFSITKKSLWALEILAEEGYSVDSSIFPVRHDRYGIPDAPTHFHPLDTAAGTIWECPPSVLSLGKINVPVAGGGYFRLCPLSWTRHFLKRATSSGQPFVLYLHPWEFDPDQPRLAIGSRLTRFRHYVNLSTTESKLDRLLSEFRFARLSDVLSRQQDDLLVAKH
jgi:polysaccharide deacetylase family protein (PEP-CTERM system associated)